MSFLHIFKGKKGKLEKRSESNGKRKSQKPAVAPKKEAKEVRKEAKKPKRVSIEEAKKEDKEDKKEIALKTPPSLKTPLQAANKTKREAKTALSVLEFPRITEKATFLQENDQYVFRVFSTTTKPEIKKSIEEVYGVDVLGVKVVNMKRKSKRLGRSRGFRAGYKKAIIKIKKGQTIEVMPR